MKKLMTSVILVWFSLFSYAQNVEWKKCYGGSDQDMAFSIINSNDDGYIIVGSSKSNDGDVTSNNGSSDFWVVKIDDHGAIMWEKNYGLSNYERPFSITSAHDGGYVIAGHRNAIEGNPTDSDFWVVKITEEGEIIWDHCYGGPDFDQARHIIKTNDNCYIISGTTILPDDFYKKAIRALKINQSGNIIWEKTFLETNCMNLGSSVLTPDNGVIFVVDDCSTNSDYFIVRLDAWGKLKWQKGYGGSLADRPASIKPCSEGGYVIVGSSASVNGYVTINHGNFDFWVIKIDDNGNLLSGKCFGGSRADMGNDVIQNVSNEHIVVGYTSSDDGDVTNFTDKTDFWIFKMDAGNELIWEKCIGDYSGDDIAQSVIKAGDNGYLVAGYTDSYEGEVTGNHGDHDFWVIKISENPNLIHHSEHGIDCKIYPNPTDRFINIHCENILEVEITDVNGRSVFRSDINLNMIDLSLLSKGIYYVKVTNDQGWAIEKIVLE